MSVKDVPIRVLLAGDNSIMQEALQRLLCSQANLTVVAEASSCEDTVALATQHQPDLILVDYLLQGHTGLDCVVALREALGQPHIIVFMMPLDAALCRRAVSLGALGLVCQDQPAEILLRAIEAVAAGEVWIERGVIAGVLRSMSRQYPDGCPEPEPPCSNNGSDKARIDSLTLREYEIFQVIGEGLNNNAIAGRLFISERTVHKHLTSLYQKFDVTDRLELTILAYRYRGAAS